MIWIITALILQCIIAAVVIFVLKRVLDRELIDAALEQLHKIDTTESISRVTVCSVVVLSASVEQRFKSAIERKFFKTDIVFEQRPGLKGGILIEWAGGSIDCSLANRLKSLNS